MKRNYPPFNLLTPIACQAGKTGRISSNSTMLGQALIILVLCGLFAAASQPLQEKEDLSRKLWNKQFETARKRAGKGKPRGKAHTIGKDLIGLTIWRLREVSSNETVNIPRLLFQQRQLIPERIGIDTIFSENDRVRLSIEVPRVNNHYLYVIDREVYDDGTMSAPYLIFPTRRTRGGDNTVRAGKLIQIPALEDNPPYFNFTSFRKDRVRERLTIIVSPQSLSFSLGDEPLQLDPSQVTQWEKQWGGTPEWRETPNSLGRTWTAAEKEAGDGARLLSQLDPLPQTMYRARSNPSGHLLIVVALRIAP
jgi:hypothetical protein